MKKLTLLFFVLIFANGIFAQKNALKGRAFATPNLFLFSLGFGFERMIGEDFSAQILFNRMGYDMHRTDGGAESANFVVPEVRFYPEEKENKKVFFGVFTEFSKTNFVPSGEGHPDTVLATTRISQGSSKNTISPGTLIGWTNGTQKPFLFECYVGGKYRIARETKKYILNQENVTEKRNTKKLGIRVGINIGYRF